MLNKKLEVKRRPLSSRCKTCFRTRSKTSIPSTRKKSHPASPKMQRQPKPSKSRSNYPSFQQSKSKKRCESDHLSSDKPGGIRSSSSAGSSISLNTLRRTSSPWRTLVVSGTTISFRENLLKSRRSLMVRKKRIFSWPLSRCSRTGTFSP